MSDHHNNYQGRTINAYYYAEREQEISRLRAANRKLRWTVTALLIVGTIQWLLGLVT